MSRIIDQRLLDICSTGACADLPAALWPPARKLASLLLAVRAIEDIDLFTRLANLADGRLAVPAWGRWFIVFNWIPELGAKNLALQRL